MVRDDLRRPIASSAIVNASRKNVVGIRPPSQFAPVLRIFPLALAKVASDNKDNF
jgi:hypothetical protein